MIKSNFEFERHYSYIPVQWRDTFNTRDFCTPSLDAVPQYQLVSTIVVVIHIPYSGCRVTWPVNITLTIIVYCQHFSSLSPIFTLYFKFTLDIVLSLYCPYIEISPVTREKKRHIFIYSVKYIRIMLLQTCVGISNFYWVMFA